MVDDDRTPDAVPPAPPSPWVPPSQGPPTPPPAWDPLPPLTPAPPSRADLLVGPAPPPAAPVPPAGPPGAPAPGWATSPFAPPSPTSPPVGPPPSPRPEPTGPTGSGGGSPPLVAPTTAAGDRLPSAPPVHGAPPVAPELPPLPTTALPPEDPDRRRGQVLVLVVVAVLSAVLASLVTAGIVVAVDRGGSSRSGDTAADQLAGRGLDIHALLEKAQPSVVSIQTGDADTRDVYGSAGSGVIISDDGLVLTNAHVIASSSTLQVTTADGRSLQADLVGSLPSDDVALIKLRDPGPITPAELGSSADVRVGDDVVAIGNALNLGGPPSVTEGIISATDRTIQAEGEALRNLIQTDAAINPGNSGGPLLNAQGQVVGINTAIIGDAQNIGFAIAIDSIKPLIEDIKAGRGAITQDTAFLGVTSEAVSGVGQDLLDQYGVRTTDGAFVVDIQSGSAASEGGLQLGDVITAIDGQPVVGPDDVGEAVRTHKPGDQLTITYERDGETRQTTVVLKSRKDSGN